MHRFRVSVAEGAVLVLMATLLFTFWNLTSQSRRSADETIDRAFESAEVLDSFAATAHEHFTDTVRDVAATYEIPFTTDEAAVTEALRFPATFSRTLTEGFSEEFPNSQFRIYSDFPIRQEDIDERVLDDFALNALTALRWAPTEQFREVTDLGDGTTSIRLASPIIMQTGCVSCHNSPAFSVTERDWQVGDVRGVREVSLTIPSTTRLNVQNMPWLYALVAFATLLTLFLVLPSVRREVASRTYLTRKTAELSAEVELDALSGLHNRRSFDAHLAELVDAAHDEDLSLTLLSFDVDHFKRINDTYGHDGGDQVIRGIGAMLRSMVRDNDIPARIGGEEFAVIAVDIATDQQIPFASRVESAIRSTMFTTDDGEIQITVSGGCVTLRPDETALDFYKRSDRLLYEAKRSGRDQLLFDSTFTEHTAGQPHSHGSSPTNPLRSTLARS